VKLIKRLSVVFVLLLAFNLFSFAQLEKVRFNRISIKQGLSQSSVNKVIQDKDGFIWIGTQDGLNKYDGYNISVFYNDPSDTNSISNNYINCLLQDSKGYIWIGTDFGLCRYDPIYEKFERYFEKNGLPDNSIREIIEDQTGKLWVGTINSGLVYFEEKGNEFKSIDREIDGDVRSLFVSSSNILWIGTDKGSVYNYNIPNQNLIKIHNAGDQSIHSVWDIEEKLSKELIFATDVGLFLLKEGELVESPLNKRLPGVFVRSVYLIDDNQMWVGTNEGLVQLIDNQINVYQYESNNANSITHNQIQDIFLDRGGVMWAATNSGLNKFDTEKIMFSHYREIKGNDNTLHGQNVWSIYETKDKKLWVGTRQGLNVYAKDRKKVYFLDNVSGSRSFAKNRSVMSIYEDRQGRLYVGAVDGIYEVKRDEDGVPIEFVKLEFNSPSFENMVYTITEDKDNRLWVGTKQGLIVFNETRNSNSFFVPNNLATSLPHKTIRNIKICNDNSVWIGTEGGLSKVLYFGVDSLILKTYNNSVSDLKSLSNNMVISILETSKKDVLWLGTYGGGLNIFNTKTEVFSNITERNGIANNVVYGVLSDSNSNLWLSTNKGLSFYNTSTKQINNYIENDGLQSNEFNIGAFFQSTSGELFFGGINGFNSFMPEKIQINKKPPQIVFTGIKFSNKKAKIGDVLSKHIQATSKLNLTYRYHDLSIEFAALHYSFPEKNTYAYKMVGYDEDWVEVGTQRFATYTNLDDGEYTFLVKGRNSDGIESESVASLAIIITPPFWGTWWFRISSVLAILGIVVLIYKVRVKQIEDQKEALEQIVQDRTAVVMQQKDELMAQKALIEEEKEKSEKLLLNILPQETADELKHRGKASARNYKQATVMFTDFKGFTQISEKFTPQQVVEKLDSYFIKYDEIIEGHDMEKIKTIGDAYMAAGGVPIRNKSNPIDVVLAGLKIQRYMASLREIPEIAEDVWQVRIGIHTGELIAGVIGIKRFAYDIWGDTVNVANRMEMTCDPDKVNISGETYQHIKGFFECTERGKIEAKNKGEIEMYFVDSIKPELSIDGKGEEPNDMFWEYVDLSLYSSINYHKAEKFIIKTLKDGLSPDLFYHNLDHMQDVCAAVTRLGKLEGIKGEELFLLRTAALYHDAGFVEQYRANEPLGAKMARETLPKYGYSEDQIKLVENLILSTKVPQQPNTHLEQIICDADLDYLGRDDFHPIADNLCKEFTAYGVVAGEKSWDELQVKFLNSHSYFTPSAIKTRRAKKLEHLEFVKQRLSRGNYKT
jgi:ligand-binding sensor domain-containing protein/class 3 adenylate cyclase/predicted metal-dependent HD superfamily phosphohydrolase